MKNSIYAFVGIAMFGLLSQNSFAILRETEPRPAVKPTLGDKVVPTEAKEEVEVTNQESLSEIERFSISRLYRDGVWARW